MATATAAESMQDGALRPGTVVASRYLVEALLGEGGAASVYRVRDAQTGQRVALKQLRLDEGKHRALLTMQFEREYHTLSQLAHPSIIEVYDYGMQGGSPYYTMELLDGEDLRERGRLPFREVCTLLCDVASSLAIVHSRNRVHRDVSARNVRCTQQGHAKLLDFGAMAAMGIASQPVGTPPFVPPEALQLQPLDGRVDLYALGALAYFMLTGRHAYPARTLAQLRDLWRSAPPTPRQYEPSVPEALDRLVMELLQLERAARPRSAAEVMERLAAIAGVPLQELPEVQRAYLSVPMLVGREAELQQVRANLVTGLQGRGSSMLIEGAAGVGRSRMLDACVLEAKLLGAVVLRADAATRTPGDDYGLLRRLCSQLLSAVPVLVEQAARPRRALLAHVMPELGLPRVDHPAQAAEAVQRRQLQAALRDFFLAVAREHLIVIAVDDVALVDEASSALLGMLAHGAARRRLCLLLTICTGGEPTPVLTLLRQVAQTIALAPLPLPQTRTLIQSLFGDVEHGMQLAERIHGLADGNPRWVMALCERLVERGVARYHAGRWTLPAELGPDVVPNSLAAELEARIEALPEDARELAQTLALTNPAALSLPDYAELVEGFDHARTYRALDALVAAGVLVATEDHYEFRQQEFVRLLQTQAGSSPERTRALHGRLATLLANSVERRLYAYHLQFAGRSADAVAVSVSLPHDLSHFSRAGTELQVRTLLAALEPSSQLSQRQRFDAFRELTFRATVLGRRDVFLQAAPVLLERARRDGGFDDYTAITAGTEQERMQQAMQRAAERYAQTAPEERVFSPQEALLLLASLGVAFLATASAAHDLDLLERMPSLAPLAALYPGVGLMQHELEIQHAAQRGRGSQAFLQSLALIERLHGPEAGHLPPVQLRNMRLSQNYVQGLMRAAIGRDVPAELLAELEQVAGYRALAWRVRMISEFMRGNFEAGAACERRVALMNLQDGGILPGSTVRTELLAHIAADNLSGVQKNTERAAELSALYPGWRSTHAIARCHTLRLQGDLAGALQALQPALELTQVDRHIDWVFAVQTQMQVLTELGRAAEAVACGRRAVAQADAHDFALPAEFRLALGTALLHHGELEAARQTIDAAVADHERSGARGLMLGAAYEAQARLAIARGDAPALQQAAERCAQEFKVGANSLMNARYERLLRDANAAGLALPASAQWVAAAAAPAGDAVARTVYSRMLTCIGSVERGREALRLLLDASGAVSGYLFGLRAGKLRPLASVDEAQTPQALVETLERYLCDELEAQEAAPPAAAGTPAGPPLLQPWVDALGREFEPLLVRGVHDGDAVIAGVAVLHHEADERPALPNSLLQALTEALIVEDIIDPITCAS